MVDGWITADTFKVIREKWRCLVPGKGIEAGSHTNRQTFGGRNACLYMRDDCVLNC